MASRVTSWTHARPSGDPYARPIRGSSPPRSVRGTRCRSRVPRRCQRLAGSCDSRYSHIRSLRRVGRAIVETPCRAWSRCSPDARPRQVARRASLLGGATRIASSSAAFVPITSITSTPLRPTRRICAASASETTISRPRLHAPARCTGSSDDHMSAAPAMDPQPKASRHGPSLRLAARLVKLKGSRHTWSIGSQASSRGRARTRNVASACRRSVRSALTPRGRRTRPPFTRARARRRRAVTHPCRSAG